MSFNDKEKKFLLELEQLTRKYKISIGGCGCCGSPRLYCLKASDLVENAGYGSDCDSEIAWISPNDKYNWDKKVVYDQFRGFLEVFIKSSDTFKR